MPEQETAEPRGPIEGSALVEGVAIGRAVVWGSDPAEDAVTEAASRPSSRLTVDARARPFVGLAHGERSGESSPESRDGHRVLVTSTLTPSVVAALPVRVVGILAAPGDEGVPGGTSHAVILARARGIPLVRVRPEAIEAVRDDDTVVLDATRAPALVWLAPRAATVSEAWSRRESWARARLEEPGSVATRLDHLGVKLCVSVSSFDEHIPAAAEGVGLLRTELVFFRRARAPVAEQVAAICAIATRAGRVPVVVRLFDAGGDKPLAWLREPPGSSMRGIELLLRYPAVLDAQLRAVTRAAEHADIHVLLPLVRSGQDVARVRARSGGKIPIGALVETPEATERIDEIASVSDFVSIGTNDLFASATGRGRVDPALSMDAGVLRMIERVVSVSHAHGRKVSVCGEWPAIRTQPEFWSAWAWTP
jgi:multiphosphoryl transfer protein